MSAMGRKIKQTIRRTSNLFRFWISAIIIGSFVLSVGAMPAAAEGPTMSDEEVGELQETPEGDDAALSMIEPTGKVNDWKHINKTKGKLPSGKKTAYTVVFELRMPDDGSRYEPALCTDIHTGISKNKRFMVDPSGTRSCEITWVLNNYPVTFNQINGYDYPFEFDSFKEYISAVQSAVWYLADDYNITSPNDIKKDTQSVIDAVNAQFPEDEVCTFPEGDQGAAKLEITPAVSSVVFAEANASQTFTVVAMQGETPVANKEVTIETDFGAPSVQTVTTDENGEAVFTITASQAGMADIDVSAQMHLPIGTRFIPMPGAEDQQVMVLAKEMDDVEVQTKATANWRDGGELVVHTFSDNNMNGVQDDGEVNLGNVSVNVPGVGNGKTVDTGNKTFKNVQLGSYTINASKNGWYQTTENPTTAELGAEGSALVNIGFVQMSVIQAISFYDENGNGERDAEESLIEGSHIKITPSVNGMTGKETDENGSAVFEHVAPAEYVLKHTAPEGWYMTTPPEVEVDVKKNKYKLVEFGVAPEAGEINAALVVDVDANETVVETGSTVKYSVKVSNVGSDPATDMEVNHELPEGVTYQAGTATVDGEPLNDPVNNVWKNLPDLAAEGSMLIEFEATVDDTAKSYLYSATASGKIDGMMAIPPDNSEQIPADTDPDDTDTVLIGVGTLSWQNESTFVAYEDRKNDAHSDWDYNDIVMHLDINKGVIGDYLSALEIEYRVMAKSADYDHIFVQNLPINGGGLYEVTVYDENDEQVASTGDMFGSESTFVVFDHTEGTIPNDATNAFMKQAEFVEGYRAVLTVVLEDPMQNPVAELGDIPWDPYIHVYDTGEEVHLPVPGHSNNMQAVQDVEDTFGARPPLVGEDLPLVRAFESTWRWPFEYVRIWRGYPSYVDFVKTGGTVNVDWFEQPYMDWVWNKPLPGFAAVAMLTSDVEVQDAPESAYFASPTAADLDGDGAKEIIMGNLLATQVELYDAQQNELWTRPTQGGVKAAATTADLNGDGMLEIVAGDTAGMLYAWERDGSLLWSTAVNEDYRILATPTMADFDANGSVDTIIVPMTDGKLYAVDTQGNLMAGWPLSIGDVAEEFDSQVINSAPVVANLDGQGMLEVVVGSYDKQLYVFNFDNQFDTTTIEGIEDTRYMPQNDGDVELWKAPVDDVIMSTPAVADIDPTMPGLEIVFASSDGAVYMLDKNGLELWSARTEWTVRSSPMVEDIDGDGDLEVIIGSDDDQVWAWHHDGTLVAGWPQSTTVADAAAAGLSAEGSTVNGADIFSSPTKGDVDGDGVMEIVVGSDNGYVYAWEADGSLVEGWPKPVGTSVKGKPAMVNNSVVVGDTSGTFSAIQGAGTSNNSVLFLPSVMR